MATLVTCLKRLLVLCFFIVLFRLRETDIKKKNKYLLHQLTGEQAKKESLLCFTCPYFFLLSGVFADPIKRAFAVKL